MSILKSLFVKMIIIIIFVGILRDRHETGILRADLMHRGQWGIRGLYQFLGQDAG